MAIDDMLTKSRVIPSNLSILIAEYGALCHEVLYDPESRVRYWLGSLVPKVASSADSPSCPPARRPARPARSACGPRGRLSARGN